MAIEGGNFTAAFFKEDSVRDLFNVEEQQKQKEAEKQIVPKLKEKEKEKKSQNDGDEKKPQTENDITNEQYEKVLRHAIFYYSLYKIPKLY